MAVLLLQGIRLAGDWSVQTWRTENGLPDGTVTALAQTADGHVWVGTRSGLVRFDGTSFAGVMAGAGDDEIVRRSGVDALLVDRSDTLWVLSRSGALARLRKGRIETLHKWLPLLRPLTGYGPHWFQTHLMAGDATGGIWVMSPDLRLWRIDASRNAIEVSTPSGVKGDLRGCWSDPTGTIWIVKGDVIAKRTPDSWQVFHTDQAPALRETVACAGHGGQFWVVEPGDQYHVRRLRAWDPTGTPGRFIDVPTQPIGNDGHLTALLEDHAGGLWVNLLWGGLHRRTSSGHWETVPSEGPLKRAIVTALMEDSSGGIWVGTLGAGLHLLRPNSAKPVMLPAAARDAFVTSMDSTPQGDLWMGTDRAGVFFKGASGEFHRSSADGLPHDHITAILANPDHSAWVGSRGGVVRMGSDGSILMKPRGSLVKAIHRDRHGNVWMSNNGALCEFEDGDPERARVFAPDKSESLDIRAIAESIDGRIWIAAFGSGIWQVDGQRLIPAGFKEALGRTDTRCLHADEDGEMWIGTFYGGLFRWDGQKVFHYGVGNGLRDDSIQSITSDREGRLWFGSNNGVFGIRRRELVEYEPGRSPPLNCWHVTESDGLLSRTCSGGGQPTARILPDGRFFFANMGSVAVIDTHRDTRRPRPPTVSVLGLAVDGQHFDPASLPVEIQSGTRDLDFLYAAPDFLRAHSLSFEFRLDGLDPDWVPTRNPNSARYSRLPPGSYRFRVRVKDEHGNWHECGQPLSLRIVPALWERAPVQIAAGSLLMLSAVGLSASIQRRRHRREIQLIEQERSRIARDLHDDLGARLAEVTLLSAPERKEFSTPASASTHGLLISRKIRSAMDSLNEIIWAVNPIHDHLPQLLDHLCSMSAEACESAGVRCWQDVPVGAPRIPLSAMTRHHTSLAVREAVRNSLVHSGTTEIWLDVRLQRGKLLISVRDSGCGFDPERVRGTGNGLANLANRMREIGGSFDVSSAPGSPTLVTLTIPIPIA